MNPVDRCLLWAYIALAACAAWVAVSLIATFGVSRRARRWAEAWGPAPGTGEGVALAAYELAYLAGGPSRPVQGGYPAGGYQRVVEAATAALTVRGAVRAGADAVEVCGELPAGSHAVEAAVYEVVRAEGGPDRARAKEAHLALAATIAPISDRLMADGYLVPYRRAAAAKLAMWATAVVAVAPGLILTVILNEYCKFPGDTRAVPALIWFLFGGQLTLCIVWGLRLRFHLTPHGARALAAARERHASLRPPRRDGAPQLAGPDVVLSAGLFGLEEWRTGPLAGLHSALYPPGEGTPA